MAAIAPASTASSPRAASRKPASATVAWLFAGVDRMAAARGLLARGPKLVVVTLGAEGALGVCADAEVPVGSSGASRGHHRRGRRFGGRTSGVAARAWPAEPRLATRPRRPSGGARVRLPGRLHHVRPSGRLPAMAHRGRFRGIGLTRCPSSHPGTRRTGRRTSVSRVEFSRGRSPHGRGRSRGRSPVGPPTAAQR